MNPTLIRKLIAKKTAWLVTPIILVFMIIQHQEVQAVFGIGIIKQDVEMSPEVKGRLTENGEPLANVTITRRFAYEGYRKGEEQLDYTQTNLNGEFSFPEIIIKSRYPKDIFGQNAMVHLAVYHEKNEKKYQLWRSSSPWLPLATPVAMMLINLNGELTNKEIHYEIDTSAFSEVRMQIVSSICYYPDHLNVAYYGDDLISSFSDLKHLAN